MSYNPHLNRSYGEFNANDIIRMAVEEINDTIGLTEDILEEAAQYGVRQLERRSPKQYFVKKPEKNSYAKGWRIRKAKPKGYAVGLGQKFDIRQAVSRVIYNVHGRLTHILEHGTGDRKTMLGFRRGKGPELRHIENAKLDVADYINQMIDRL